MSGYAWIRRRRGLVTTRAIASCYVLGSAIRWSLFGLLAVLIPTPWSERRDAMRQSMRYHAQGLRPAETLQRHR
jgi:hypothetical protein